MINQKFTFPFFRKGIVGHTFKTGKGGGGGGGTVSQIFNPENLNDDLPMLVDTSLLSVIVRVSIVLKRTVVVDSD